MKLFTCLAHVGPEKLPYLQQVLHMQQFLFDEVHVSIATNKTDQADLDLIASVFPPATPTFQVEIVNRNYEHLPSAWLLTWVHKDLMAEKFQDPSYTHFMYIEDDMEVTATNIQYWMTAREHLRPYGLYPSFMRTEWNPTLQQWAWTDSVKGDRFSVKGSPRVDLMAGYGYINLPRTYQGMFLYDRELMQEHIASDSFSLEKFVPGWQTAIQHTVWPLGLTEMANLALTNIHVPQGCISRNFLPYYPKYNTINPCCFVHHLPDKYTNAPESENGKVMVADILAP